MKETPMNYDTGRVWVKLTSRQALDQYMKFRGETNRSLADKCGPNVQRAIISHLRSGARTTCSGTTAHAIEKALEVPPGLLFVATVTTGDQVSGRAA
jgi:hypothetical protein